MNVFFKLRPARGHMCIFKESNEQAYVLRDIVLTAKNKHLTLS